MGNGNTIILYSHCDESENTDEEITANRIKTVNNLFTTSLQIIF